MSFYAHKFNEMVLQLLFSLDMGECLEEDLIPFLMRELSVTRKSVRTAYQKARAIYDARKEFDKQIEATSQAYALERIGRVERNILRLALYDFQADHIEQSREQTLAEALRLTRKFSTKEATAFVNALLDTEAAHGEGSTFSTPKEQTSE